MRHDLFAAVTFDGRGKGGSAPRLLRYSEQFLPGHTIISFWFGQTLSKIGDDTPLTIYILRQYSPKGLMTCICIQNKLFPNFRICQDWSRCQCVLKLIKGVVTINRPDEFLFCHSQFMEWSGDR
ncbi:hypothetical protein TNCV_3441331 [Trichonephila clavipes]|uniref:Uncharacterized protein n=1 Tax=Trichonephila clavipes TaxID=2585209 RepID=A0A8X6W6T8_TRICX|nr:hypothetical protein TNCV_3441331 [Trichonephila clavipes]